MAIPRQRVRRAPPNTRITRQHQKLRIRNIMQLRLRGHARLVLGVLERRQRDDVLGLVGRLGGGVLLAPGGGERVLEQAGVAALGGGGAAVLAGGGLQQHPEGLAVRGDGQALEALVVLAAVVGVGGGRDDGVVVDGGRIGVEAGVVSV